jgi:hypothetical protein
VSLLFPTFVFFFSGVKRDYANTTGDKDHKLIVLKSLDRGMRVKKCVTGDGFVSGEGP